MFNETTLETFINQVKIENNVSESDGELDDNNTKFNISVIAVYGTKRSEPAVVTNISIKPKGMYNICIYNKCIYIHVILIKQIRKL